MSKVRFCEICKQAIEADRLEAVPESRLCTEHASAIKQFGGEFIVSAATEVTSKAGSMKRNYGGVTTSKVRNARAVEKLRDAFEAGTL
ncbi:MAG: TraR/DksA C4-type zinc finger protein [Pirellulales bacterium]